jgi:hypothetical protein
MELYPVWGDTSAGFRREFIFNQYMKKMKTIEADLDYWWENGAFGGIVFESVTPRLARNSFG